MKRRIRAKTGGNPWYFLKEGVLNIFLNGFMSFAAISIIMVCLLVVGCFVLTAYNAQIQIATEVEKSEIMIFIEDDFLLATIQDELDNLKTTSSVVLDEEDENSDDDENSDEDETSDEEDEDLEEYEIEEDTLSLTEEDALNLAQMAYISAFMNEPKDQLTYIEIESRILQVIDVASVTYVSKEEALQAYKEQLGDVSFIVEGFENDNPLRDGFIVHLNSLQFVDEVTLGLNLIEGVAEVSSRNETYKALYNIEKGFNIMSVIFLLAFGAISIFIISNTVKLALFARKEEIAIMKMIGAKNAFIKWPFIIEGLLLGVIASLVAFGFTWYLYVEAITFASEFIGFVSIIPFEVVRMRVFYSYLAIGSIIGTFGSLFTIRKFLDV